MPCLKRAETNCAHSLAPMPLQPDAPQSLRQLTWLQLIVVALLIWDTVRRWPELFAPFVPFVYAKARGNTIAGLSIAEQFINCDACYSLLNSSNTRRKPWVKAQLEGK